jgi:hypothetical protein
MHTKRFPKKILDAKMEEGKRTNKTEKTLDLLCV